MSTAPASPPALAPHEHPPGAPVPADPTTAPAPDRCPLCGAPLGSHQEWCLQCGAAARTRLASTSNWKAPIVAIATVAVLSLGVLAASLAALAGNFGSSGSTSATVLTPSTTGAAGTPSTSASAPAGSATSTAGAATSTTGAATGTTATPPAAATGALATKPVVTPPAGAPPTTVQIKEIITGTGPVANPGDTVTVNYVGVLYSGGAEFDSSWRRGKPFSFTLGTNQVISGWNQGVTGMRVGGRRELLVPASAAYGAQGLATRPTAIPPNAALVFVVDLLEVHPPAGAATSSAPSASPPAGTSTHSKAAVGKVGGQAKLSAAELAYIASIERLEAKTSAPAQKKRYQELLETLRKGK